MAERLWGESADVLVDAELDPDALAALERQLRTDLGPCDVEVHDVHVHLGRDADGHRLDPADLIADLDGWGVSMCAAFPANEPGEDGRFVDANRAVLEAAAEHPGRIVPFCRVDPTGEWREALHLAADAGARGLKLHPVAQSFRIDDPEAIAAVAAATAHGWPVLIHAGFGARPIASALAAVLDAVPEARLILAHGARGDVRAVIAAIGSHPGVWFDTSLAALPDLVSLTPERLLFGSDRPYGEYGTARQLVSLAARLGAWTDEQLTAVLGGNFIALLGSP
ncbi:MAG: amidohydrolase family protein [Actinobacteria bacterium]|nr:amidohydrolase family protein [Actinomycetota bacterium]